MTKHDSFIEQQKYYSNQELEKELQKEIAQFVEKVQEMVAAKPRKNSQGEEWRQSKHRLDEVFKDDESISSHISSGSSEAIHYDDHAIKQTKKEEFPLTQAYKEGPAAEEIVATAKGVASEFQEVILKSNENNLEANLEKSMEKSIEKNLNVKSTTWSKVFEGLGVAFEKVGQKFSINSFKKFAEKLKLTSQEIKFGKKSPKEAFKTASAKIDSIGYLHLESTSGLNAKHVLQHHKPHKERMQR